MEEQIGYDKILVPLDGSELAELAIPHAIRIANTGAWIHLLSVMDANCFTEVAVKEASQLTSAGMDKIAGSLEPNDDALEVFARKNYLLNLADKLRLQGYKATAQLIAGYPSSAIASIACEGFDMVVISTHGRTGLRKILIGSVAEEVLHDSPCPVCIIPAYSSIKHNDAH